MSDFLSEPAAISEPVPTNIVSRIDVHMDARGIEPVVHLTQYDMTLPVIAVSADYNSQPYKYPEGAAVNIRMEKPDGKHVYNPAMGLSADRLTAYIGVTKQMTAADGIARAAVEVVLDGGVAASGAFTIFVDRNPVKMINLESDDEYLTLQELAAQAAQSAKEAQDAQKAAGESQTKAQANQEAAESAQHAAESAKNLAEAAKDEATAQAGKAGQSASDASDSKDAAKLSEDAATESARQAKESQQAASDSETQAGLSADAAEQSAQQADTAKTDAQTAKDQAEAAQGKAETAAETATAKAGEASDSADQAAASAKTAEDWSNKSKSYAVGEGDAERQPPEATDNSLYYSQQAKASQQAATEAQTAAESAKADAETARDQAQAVADKLQDLAGGDVVTSEELATAVEEHNTSPEAHADIREKVEAATSKHWDISVTASGWTETTDTKPAFGGITAQYQNQVSAEGMTADTDISGIVFTSGDRASASAWAWLAPSEGTVTLYAVTKPTQDFGLRLTEVK